MHSAAFRSSTGGAYLANIHPDRSMPTSYYRRTSAGQLPMKFRSCFGAKLIGRLSSARESRRLRNFRVRSRIHRSLFPGCDEKLLSIRVVRRMQHPATMGHAASGGAPADSPRRRIDRHGVAPPVIMATP